MSWKPSLDRQLNRQTDKDRRKDGNKDYKAQPAVPVGDNYW